MAFSILICTYNRHELLRRALHVLIEGAMEKPDRVVVVNSGDGRADQVVRSYADMPGVQAKLAKSGNRNLLLIRRMD